MIQLPNEYIHRMEAYLREQSRAFLDSYSEPRTYGLRVNLLKICPSDPSMDKLKALFQLAEVPWCPSGFYYEENTRPGKHPYHAAGVYYIQEPSAMSAVEWLSPYPGDIVLDLAAAPGGKSTHIAGKLQGNGLLIANEIHPARAKILSENIERIGVRNCVVTNSTPGQLAKKFPLFFDKIMVDAPCSGEGMFRKDPDAVKEWSVDHVAMCASRQMDILEDAAKMLKAGGKMAYSTCTFSEEENELVIAAFVQKYPEFTVLQMERIWPHLHQGEGHFVAVLEKKQEGRRSDRESGEPAKTRSLSKQVKEAQNHFHSFAAEMMPGFKLALGEPILFGEQLYWLPHAEGCPFQASFLDGLKVLRPGLHLATIKKNRIEPAHALAMASVSGQVEQLVSLPYDGQEVHAFLKGETLNKDNITGWVIIAVDEYALGWGKASNGQIKNHYPKGLRFPG